MRTSHIWWIAALIALAGAILQVLYSNTEAETPWQDPLGLLGSLLLVLPLTLALNITLRRRRDRTGESSPDSVEFRAAQLARSQAFTDAVMLGALLMLLLAIMADATAALLALLFVNLAVAAFWIRYRLALRALGG